MEYEEFCFVIKRAFENTGLVDKVYLGMKENDRGKVDIFLRLIEFDDPAEVDIFLYPYYLRYFYSDYCVGEVLFLIIQDHLELKFGLAVTEDQIVDNLENIIFSVVNYDLNREVLKKLPHYRYKDLAVLFSFYVENDYGLFPIVHITNEVTDRIGISRSELCCLAYFNTKAVFSYSLKKLVVEGGSRSGIPVLPDGEGGGVPIYVLSSKNKRFGSVFLLYPHILHEVAEKIKRDFFIIPASVDELILIPEMSEIDSELVLEIHNDSRFNYGDGDYLTSNVYYFDSGKDEIVLECLL